MTIKEWKAAIENLVNDFQFATDIPELEKLVEEAKRIKAEKEG